MRPNKKFLAIVAVLIAKYVSPGAILSYNSSRVGARDVMSQLFLIPSFNFSKHHIVRCRINRERDELSCDCDKRTSYIGASHDALLEACIAQRIVSLVPWVGYCCASVPNVN